MFKSSESRTFHFSPFKNHLFTEARLVWGFARNPEVGHGEDEGKRGREVAKKNIDRTKFNAERKKLAAEVQIDRWANKTLEEHKDEIKGFIETHTNLTGGIEGWNQDFLTAIGDQKIGDLGIKLLQSTLFRRLNLRGDSRAVIDGKMGPYTLAALAVYTGNELPAFARLGSNITPKHAEGADALNEWMGYADKDLLLQRMLDMPKEELFQAFESSLGPNDLSDLVGTLEGEATELFYNNLEKVIVANEGQIDTSTADGWRRAFKKAGLKDYEIEGMGLKTERTQKSEVQVATPATNSSSNNDAPRAGGRKAINKLEVKVNLKNAPELIKTATEPFNKESEEILNELFNEKEGVSADFDELWDDPNDWFNSIANLNGPNEVLDEYKKAYYEWKEANKDKRDYADQARVREAAYGKLKESITVFYNRLNETVINAQNKYNERMTQEIMPKYSFPQGMPLDRFNNESQAQEIYNGHPFTRQLNLKGVKYFDAFIEDYLEENEVPKRAIGSIDELKAYLRGSEEDKELNLKEIIDFIEGRDRNPVEAVNSWIYFHNAIRFAAENEQLLREVRTERNEQIRKIRGL